MNASSLKRIERGNYILGGLATAAAAIFLPREATLGVLVGVLIGAINFSMIKRIVERWLADASTEGGTGKSGYFMFPKMALLMAAVFLALKFLPISPAYLAAGFSIFLLSIGVETARSMTAAPTGDSDEDAA